MNAKGNGSFSHSHAESPEDEVARLVWSALDGQASRHDLLRLQAIVEQQRHAQRLRREAMRLRQQPR